MTMMGSALSMDDEREGCHISHRELSLGIDTDDLLGPGCTPVGLMTGGHQMPPAIVVDEN